MIDIDRLIMDAMRSKEMDRLSVLKLVKAEFMKKATEPGRDTKVLSDGEQIAVMRKMVSAHKESITQYEMVGRMDLADIERNELTILNELLPNSPSEEELVDCTLKAIKAWLTVNGNGYVLSMRDMRSILSTVKETYQMADAKVVSRVLSDEIKRQREANEESDNNRG
ncbi:MAG: GatB/YqeY domain-containing protein [Paludibacteraceae bacterium]|nr:GatB/YqeY domain-containing protein [Paludibacteraceae bacterium]